MINLRQNYKNVSSDPVISGRCNSQTRKRMSKLGKSGWNYPEMISVRHLEVWKSVNLMSPKVIFGFYDQVCAKMSKTPKILFRTRSYQADVILILENECQN